MKKRIIALTLVFAFIMSAFGAFAVLAEAESSTPEMSIAYCNLSFINSVCIKYAVKSNVSDVKILIWTSPDATYTVGTQDDEITEFYKEDIYGVSHMVFDYTKLTAKQMTDVVYARAYVQVDGVDYYSAVNKYSILQYAYNMLGKADTDTELKEMLTHMLEYGAAAQKYLDDYKVDRLATADWYQVKVTAGVLDDGCKHGLYLPGDTVIMTAPATNESGAAFVGWKNSNDNVVSNDRAFELTVGSKNEVYTPFYEGEEPKAPKSLKVLAIGNSFAVDAMEYLYQIAEDAGVENIVLGTLRVSGCTLDMHYDYVTNETAAYRYLKNTDGTWSSTEGNTLLTGLQDEDWDIITLQQGSHESGLADTYTNLEYLANYVKTNATNPDVKLFWHMTWAYQQGCSHSGFPSYNSDQMTMYNMIVDATQEKVLSLDMFEGVIPSGTAVQNVRTSFLGDNINRDDGYHMAQPMGRYLVGLTYFAALTGADISDITYTPSTTASSELLAMFKECVTNAINNKYEVTQSEYTTGSAVKTDAELAAEIGVDLSGYTQLEFEYIENKYWFCTSKYDAPRDSSDTQSGKFVCTATRYTRAELLNAVIICDDGWQYRPERWPDATTLAEARPDNVSTPAVLLNYDWWGTDTYFAMNISKVSGDVISSDYADAVTHVRIYIPNDSVAQSDAVLASNIGVDLSEYEALDYEYTENKYWHCKNYAVTNGPIYNASYDGKFVCTATSYTKEQLLNAVIICDEGWQYRPDRWLNATDKATSRPNNVTTSAVLLDEDWWGEDNYIALNISKTSGNIAPDYADAVTHVRIYVPKG